METKDNNSKAPDKTGRQEKNRPCPGCGGSGQTSFFGGESRFLLSWEDCPDCSGTGVDLSQDTTADRAKQL